MTGFAKQMIDLYYISSAISSTKALVEGGKKFEINSKFSSD